MSIGTPEAYDEMVRVISPLAESDDKQALTRLGKAYLNGRGVEKNLVKAKELFRKASALGYNPASNALFDVLYSSNSAEDHREAVEVIRPNADKNDGFALGRLARAYRDGKGVERDMDRAISLMSAAAERNVPWAFSELIDYLLERGNDNDVRQVYEWCISEADRGNTKAMATLSLLHRKGT